MKSAKGVKPPFNWSKHLNHVIFSFYTFTFNIFVLHKINKEITSAPYLSFKTTFNQEQLFICFLSIMDQALLGNDLGRAVKINRG